MAAILGLIVVWLLKMLFAEINTYKARPRNFYAPRTFYVQESQHDSDNYRLLVHNIKINILKTYCDDTVVNKREKIIKLLSELSQFEDSTDFLEMHRYIHNYIFNRYVA